MPYRHLVTAALILLLMAPAALTQDDNPTVAIMRFGPLANYRMSEGGILDVLESYGYITEEDNRILEDRVDHEAAGINIVWGDAGSDYATASLMLQQAIDDGADALLTLGAQITLAALGATEDMDSPLPIFFIAVSEPYGIGIAESACEKPAHITGSINAPSYQFALAVMKMQNPDMQRVGTIYSTTETAGSHGADQLEAFAAQLDIEVEKRGAVSLADLRLAAYALVENGAEAIILPLDALVTQGLPIVVTIANDVGIPVFYPSFGAVYYGATIGAGTAAYYAHGVNGGRLLATHFNGELDIANTGIATVGEPGIGVNLDSAEAQGVELSQEVLDNTSLVWKDGAMASAAPDILAALATHGVIVPLEDRQEEDQEWLASLQCDEAE